MTRDVQLTSCPTEQLILFHYAELDEGDCRQVEQHVQQCRACRAELSSLREVLAQVPTAVPELTAGELQRFSSRVMQQLPRRQRFNRPVLGWALAGAVAVLLALNLNAPVETLIPAQVSMPMPMMAEQEMVNQLELLQNLDLLENLDLLQQLASRG